MYILFIFLMCASYFADVQAAGKGKSARLAMEDDSDWEPEPSTVRKSPTHDKKKENTSKRRAQNKKYQQARRGRLKAVVDSVGTHSAQLHNHSAQLQSLTTVTNFLLNQQFLLNPASQAAFAQHLSSSNSSSLNNQAAGYASNSSNNQRPDAMEDVDATSSSSMSEDDDLQCDESCNDTSNSSSSSSSSSASSFTKAPSALSLQTKRSSTKPYSRSNKSENIKQRITQLQDRVKALTDQSERRYVFLNQVHADASKAYNLAHSALDQLDTLKNGIAAEKKDTDQKLTYLLRTAIPNCQLHTIANLLTTTKQQVLALSQTVTNSQQQATAIKNEIKQLTAQVTTSQQAAEQLTNRVKQKIEAVDSLDARISLLDDGLKILSDQKKEANDYLV